MRKMEEDINTVLDEELNNCIQKLRDATFGYEVRTFITEYEELMLRKSSMITQKFVRDTGLIQRTTSEEFMRYKRKLQHLIVLQIVQGISIILSLLKPGQKKALKNKSKIRKTIIRL